MKRHPQPARDDLKPDLTPLERDLIAGAHAARRGAPAGLTSRIRGALPRSPARRSWQPLLLLPAAAAAAMAAFLLWPEIAAPGPHGSEPVASTTVTSNTSVTATDTAASRPALPAFEAPLHRELAHLTTDAAQTVSLLRSTLSLPHRALAQPQ